MCLNHQYIKILEDLGIPLQIFLCLQNEACVKLERRTQDPVKAITFLGEVDLKCYTIAKET